METNNKISMEFNLLEYFTFFLFFALNRRKIWAKLSWIMNILLNGGAGYIGSHTAVVLLEAGFNIVIFDNLSNSNRLVLDRIEAITGFNLFL